MEIKYTTNNLTCSFHDLIYTPQNQTFLCKTAATTLCSQKQQLINFFKFFWCTTNSNIPLILTIYTFSIFLILKYTALTVDNYIAEVITKISDKLKLSQSFAAVTLLAFANGAGDLITALVASEAEGGVSYNIGALYGAGLFQCSLVVAICIFQSDKPIVYDKMIIYRDIGLYLITTLATLGFALYGFITWWTNCILLFLYILLVLIVKIEEARRKKLKKEKWRKEIKETLTENLTHRKYIERKSETARGTLRADDEEVDNESGTGSPKHSTYSIDAGKAVGIAALLFVRKSLLRKKSMSEDDDENLDLKGMIFTLKEASLRSYLKLKLKLVKDEKKKTLKEKGFFGKLSQLLDLPAEFILYFTVLPASKEQYSKLRCLLYCIPGTCFWYWVFFPKLSLDYLKYPIPVGITIFLIFVFTLKKKSPPKYFLILNTMALISALMWSKVMIRILIDILNTVEIIFNLPKSYLGLTILAVGNAMVDAITTISLCKQGAGTLAISGGYVGQMFGYLVGFGSSMLRLTLEKGDQEFRLFDFEDERENLLSLAGLGTTFLVLGVTFVYGIVRGFRMGKKFAGFVLGVYVVFLCGSTGYAFYEALTDPYLK